MGALTSKTIVLGVSGGIAVYKSAVKGGQTETDMARLIHRNGSGHFLLCVQNRSYRTSLEIRKVYRALPDPDGERHRLVRVIDESGEDYLYPRSYFVDIDVPKPAHQCFSRARASAQ